MKKQEHFWLWVAIAIIAIFCIITTFIYHPRLIEVDNLHFDYIGALVGVLTIIVTILVCWQINQTLASRRDVLRASQKSIHAFREFQQEMLNKERMHEVDFAKLEKSVSVIYRNQLFKEESIALLSNFLIISLNALKHSANLGEEHLCDYVCMDIIDCLKEGKTNRVSHLHVDNIKQLLTDIPNKNKLYYFPEVKEEINKVLLNTK